MKDLGNHLLPNGNCGFLIPSVGGPVAYADKVFLKECLFKCISFSDVSKILFAYLAKVVFVSPTLNFLVFIFYI